MFLASEFDVNDLIQFIEQVKEIYESLGVYAAIGLPFLETLFPFLPLFLMIAFNILTYGTVMGYLYTYIGTLTGTIAIFVFMRYISTSRFKQKRKENSKMEKALHWIEHTHPLLHVLVLSIPFSPTFMINYSMGLTKMRVSTFLLITAVSRGILLFICIPFGITLVRYYNEGTVGGVTMIWLSVMGMVILAGIIIGQKLRNKWNFSLFTK